MRKILAVICLLGLGGCKSDVNYVAVVGCNGKPHLVAGTAHSKELVGAYAELQAKNEGCQNPVPVTILWLPDINAEQARRKAPTFSTAFVLWGVCAGALGALLVMYAGGVWGVWKQIEQWDQGRGMVELARWTGFAATMPGGKWGVEWSGNAVETNIGTKVMVIVKKLS